MVPQSSADYYRRQQRILTLLLLAVRQAWRRMSPTARWSEQYTEDGIGAQLAMLVGAAQLAAARDADEYIAAVVDELGIVPGATAGLLAPASFAGVAGDGRPVDSLLSLAVKVAGQRFNTLRTPPEPIERPEWASDVLWESLERDRLAKYEADITRTLEADAEAALAEAGRWIEQAAATAVIDAARAAEATASAARPEVTGYVRMLNPPSCSRCVILAGRWYGWNDGFERHPLCDCRHIPSSESMASDLTVSPGAYFDSLTPAEQDKAFTKAGAEAIRLGADITQVVNSRRGMSTAQIGGRDVLISTDGTTRRGLASRARTGRNLSARLMPETIFEVATDRADVIRLLKLHGFIN